ncbi:AP2/ERF and B3 domain-containing transcription factor [Heracleum sosnowskyi]|uniref:AP2/ERF and B3 domain-containing transcription factor n=1 Tax=Heracleum sosnowskyi TaxID=360622 RepID=A0AAD8JK87_9APIA|nr:AP2/ERF and B3 domain-containing transcription factor [Heracleum sosnowskyi]
MSDVSGATVMERGDTALSRSTPRRNKRARNDSNAYSSRFKGVVALLNGHWGAQIYANHQRIWLGTFNSENEAAMAYDSAAIKLRNYDSHRNFPWSSINAQEPKFQRQFTTKEVICMIKEGSYPSKFSDYLKLQCQSKDSESADLNLSLEQKKGEFLCSKLFEKELTPSDVGSLNRLVIPKKHAVSYFPRLSNGNEASAEIDDLQLVFYDSSMRQWRFRYCYWKSSQSYVFTRGWNEFVREKKLKFKDRVIFFTYSCVDAANNIVHQFLMIDVAYYSDSVVDETSDNLERTIHFDKEDFELQKNGVNSEAVKDFDKGLLKLGSAAEEQKIGFKLFGVQII